MSFETWYELNEYKLIEMFVAKNPELSILDDDYADIFRRVDFQEFCNDIYNKEMS